MPDTILRLKVVSGDPDLCLQGRILSATSDKVLHDEFEVSAGGSKPLKLEDGSYDYDFYVSPAATGKFKIEALCGSKELTTTPDMIFDASDTDNVCRFYVTGCD